MLIYATPDDLMDGWLDEMPDDAQARRYIRAASQLVRNATRLDLYDTEPSGLPVDLNYVEAMQEATCAQVAMWFRSGIDPDAGAAGREIGIQSQTADGGSVTYADVVTGAEVRVAIDRLIPGAMLILRNAGLGSTRPCTW
ncbi:hypothetical protein [Nocardia asiatica]